MEGIAPLLQIERVVTLSPEAVERANRGLSDVQHGQRRALVGRIMDRVEKKIKKRQGRHGICATRLIIEVASLRAAEPVSFISLCAHIETRRTHT